MTKHFGEFLRFGAVGTIGFLIDAGVLQALLSLGAGYYGGRAVSFIVAATGTWALNRRYTFRGQASGRSRLAEWLHWMTLMLAGGAVNYAVYAALVATSGTVRAYPTLGVAAGSLAGMLVNYASAKWLVFRGARRILQC